ncbi:hypothetical protein ACYOEI_20525 [Singulisphaera rosea]
MPRYVIVPIVESFGEVKAVPILIQRWLRHRNYHGNVEVDIKGPVRASGVGALKVPHDESDELGIEHYVEIAYLRRPDIILVLLDADEECPKTLGTSLLARARALVPHDYPIGVVVANREYEAWFLAAFPSTRFRAGLKGAGFALTRQSLPKGTDVESIADCKSAVARLLGEKKYSPTIHQTKLTGHLPFTVGISQRSRSFRKLLKELESLLTQARQRGE